MFVFQVNHAMPGNIIVFRDGVGDGQMAVVRDHEVPQLMGTFQHFSAKYQPNFAEIVVQKRINTRLFRKRVSTRYNIIFILPCPRMTRNLNRQIITQAHCTLFFVFRVKVARVSWKIQPQALF